MYKITPPPNDAKNARRFVSMYKEKTQKQTGNCGTTNTPVQPTLPMQVKTCTIQFKLKLAFMYICFTLSGKMFTHSLSVHKYLQQENGGGDHIKQFTNVCSLSYKLCSIVLHDSTNAVKESRSYNLQAFLPPGGVRGPINTRKNRKEPARMIYENEMRLWRIQNGAASPMCCPVSTNPTALFSPAGKSPDVSFTRGTTFCVFRACVSRQLFRVLMPLPGRR